MAVSIMSAPRRASALCLLGCFLQVLVQGQVVQQHPAVFLRARRANMFLLEEILQGNLERECFEELCSYEEAREYFEDTDRTVAFWTVYYDGDQCKPNPCLHGGNCTDTVGGFQCSCAAPHYGSACELGAPGDGGQSPPSAPQSGRAEVSECPTAGPTACDQMCLASLLSFTCSCVPGFKLQPDGQSCKPEVGFPCGQVPNNTTASMCHHGSCPWQVSLLHSNGSELCAAVVLGQLSVLTAAHCVLHAGSELLPSDLYISTGDRQVLAGVQAFYIHNRFRADRHDNNLALLQLTRPLIFSHTLIRLCLPTKDYSENILMHSGRAGVAERWGVRQNRKLVYMTLDECRRQLNVSHPLSNKMFCMRRPSGTQSQVQESRAPNQNHQNQNQTQNQTQNHNSSNEAESRRKIQNDESPAAGQRSEVRGRKCVGLLPGTPVATVDRGTAFLTGLLMPSTAGCDGGGSGGLVFTKLSRYLSWIKLRLEASEDHMTSQFQQYPETY